MVIFIMFLTLIISATTKINLKIYTKMKSIKLLFVTCAMLMCVGSAVAQSEEKKPTKEETIKWLIKNLKLYGFGEKSIDIEIDIKDCVMICSYTHTTPDKGVPWYTYKLEIPVS